MDAVRIAEPTVAGGVTFGGSDEASIAAPHLLQKRVPGVIFAPQELQNAINHLMPMQCNTRGGGSIPQIEVEAECDDRMRPLRG